MRQQNTINFKATALTTENLLTQAPSIFASGPMVGVSGRYTFVPTARIVDGLKALGWVPVDVREQRIRSENRRGFQKHLIRFRRAEQMETLDEWNAELVLVNSHDAGGAYQLHAGIYRRVCANGLVVSETSFSALRFRHSGLDPDEVVQSSMRVMEYIPKVEARIGQFRARQLSSEESLAMAKAALRLRYQDVELAPVSPETVLRSRRVEDEGNNLWSRFNALQENVLRGGISDNRRDRHGRLRTVRTVRGIDSLVSLNKGLWEIAESVADGKLPQANTAVSLN